MKFTVDNDNRIFCDGAFICSVNGTPFYPSEDRLPGECWLDMRERTKPDRDAADEKAKEIAEHICIALNEWADKKVAA